MKTAPAALPGTTRDQRLGGVTGKGFLPGQSGNPAGRPKSERRLLAEMFGEDSAVVYRRLEAIRHDPKTSAKLKVEIDQFIVERQHGRAQQRVEVAGEGGGPIVFNVVTNVPEPERRDG